MEKRVAKGCKEGDIPGDRTAKIELMTANKKLNDLETSCKFLGEKYDALMTNIHDFKKHNKLSHERIDGGIADVHRARNDIMIYDNQLRLDASEQL